MKKILYLTFIIFFVVVHAHSQNTFYKSYDIWGLNKVIQTTDKGFACVTDDGLLKLDENAELVFYKKLINNSGLSFALLTQTTDQGFIIGTKFNFSNLNELTRVVKFDRFGNVQWVKRYFLPSNISVQTNDIIAVHDNGFYLLASGCVGSPILIRCNQNGDIIWQKSAPYGFASKMIRYSNNAIILAGHKAESNVNSKVWAAMIDNNGNTIWHKEFNNNRVNFVNDLIITNNNTIAILINSQDNSNVISNATSSVIQINADGNIVSTTLISSGSNVNYHKMNSFANTQDNGFIFTGTISLPTPGTKILFSKINSDNNTVFANYFGNATLNNTGTNEGVQIFAEGSSAYIFSRNEDGLSIGKIDNAGYGFCNQQPITLSSDRQQFSVTSNPITFVQSSFVSENIQMFFSNHSAIKTTHCYHSIATNINATSNVAENVICYPNPTNGEIFIETNQLKQVGVFSANGILVMQHNFNNEQAISLDMSGLAKGNYVIRIVTEQGVTLKKITYL